MSGTNTVEQADEIIQKGKSSNTTNSIIAWILAPLGSLIFMNDEDAEVKWQAKQSLYFGVFSIGLYVVGGFLSFFLGLIPVIGLLAIPLSCLLFFWAFGDLGIRIYGAIQASNGKRWEVPFIGDFMKKFIK